MTKAIWWMGGAAVIAAPFFIDLSAGKVLIIFGLAIFTVQAYRLKAWNMVLANTIGIVGYLFSLVT